MGTSLEPGSAEYHFQSMFTRNLAPLGLAWVLKQQWIYLKPKTAEKEILEPGPIGDGPALRFTSMTLIPK